MGIAAYGKDGQEALAMARQIERDFRGMQDTKLHDKIVHDLREADFPFELVVMAAWEALAE